MSDEKAQQEPTMEEILASIRRIISENDDGQAPAEGQPAPAAAPAVAKAAEAPPPKPAARQPDPPAAAEEDVLELTDMVAEEAAPGAVEPADDLVIEEAVSEPPPPPKPAAAPALAPAAPMPAVEGSDLVSQSVAAASTAAFGVLAQALNREQGTVGNLPLGSGNTLEDLVKDMLRPMLREWLDQNLAPLVERLVKREIERMVRRAEDL